MKKISTLPYRLGVGIMLLNSDNQVFVGRRIDTTSDAWQMPQGGIDDGEEPGDAVMRELKEEVGTHNAEIIAQSADWYYYDLPAEILPKIWGGKYRGQKQKWFALRFLGTDRDIDINAHEPEFSEWKWVSMAELPDIIVPFKRSLYEQIVAEFKPLV